MNRLLFSALLVTLVHISVGFDINRLNLPAEGKIWALLVAGSNTYDNYRHQADICHAYQILHKHGIPDEQIVVMMYDDIASNPQNPTKGVIINHPNGKDVYAGVPKDYIKDDVTPENFLNILQGNDNVLKGVGSGKVIKSGPSDHVFVYFADHGAPGLVAFPEGELYAKPLNAALQSMYKANKYNKMVLYVEACESGSMFDKLLPKNINIFATTAANSIESSYACYFDDQRGTYLGDLYSVNWMEDSDKENLGKETLKKQFRIVKQETNLSHVQEFGDLTISSMPVGEFQGETTAMGYDLLPEVSFDAVPSREVPVLALKRRIEKANSFEEQRILSQKLKKLLRNRDFLLNTVKAIVHKATFSRDQAEEILSENFELEDFDCVEEATRYFSENCFSLSKNDYALRYVYVFRNMCETGIVASKQKAVMDAVCTHPPVHGIL